MSVLAADYRGTIMAPRTGGASRRTSGTAGGASRRTSGTAGGASRRTGAAAPTGLRLTARGRAVVITLALVLAGFATLASQQAMAGQGGGAVVVEPRSVEAGETLWQIASEVAAPGEDVRVVVDELMELNALDSPQLSVGQELLVPAP